MQKMILEENKMSLSELINLVAGGKDVVITRKDGSSFKIVPVSQDKPFPKFGSAKGLITIADDFDEPIDDFARYMP
ncbi:DUF2281 domain-containing protein [bacterium]|nr:DUF2281 domain-containing protein [bacterium]